MSSFTASTPRMSACSRADNYGTSTYSMSLGLAAILNERDIPQTQPEGQPEGSRLFHSNQSSNPARFPSLISDTHFNTGSQSSPAVTLTLPTNSYNLIPSPTTISQRSDRGYDLFGTGSQGSSSIAGSQSTHMSQCLHVSQCQQSSTIAMDTNSANSSNTDTNMITVINKLKNTGYSFYGYLTGGDGVNENCGDNVSRPNALPLTTTTVSVATAGATGSVVMATGATVTVTTASADPNCMVTIATPTTQSPKRSQLASILTRKTAGGVIGALTKWHRDGAL